MKQIQLSCHVADHNFYFIYDLEFKIIANVEYPTRKELYEIRTQVIEQIKQHEGFYELFEADENLDIWLVDDSRVPYYVLSILSEEVRKEQTLEYDDEMPDEDKYIFYYMKDDEQLDEYTGLLTECGVVLPLEHFQNLVKVQNELIAKS